MTMAPHGPRVLVVEDQSAVAKALEVLLAIHDIPCTIAAMGLPVAFA